MSQERAEGGRREASRRPRVRWGAIGWGLLLGAAVTVHLSTGVPAARTITWVVLGWMPLTLVLHRATAPGQQSVASDVLAFVALALLLGSWAVAGA